jgi:hypothetical protein
MIAENETVQIEAAPGLLKGTFGLTRDLRRKRLFRRRRVPESGFAGGRQLDRSLLK